MIELCVQGVDGMDKVATAVVKLGIVGAQRV